MCKMNHIDFICMLWQPAIQFELCSDISQFRKAQLKLHTPTIIIIVE